MSEAIFSKAYPRKVFLTTSITILIILFLVRYIVLPSVFPENTDGGWAKFLLTLSDGLIVAILTTMFVGLFQFWMSPPEEAKKGIEVVSPAELPELFERAFMESDRWHFKGGCGRYLRTRTIPELSKWAKLQTSNREVLAAILDPRDTLLCEAHAMYRQSTNSASKLGEVWDGRTVRAELYATIVTALITEKDNNFFNIKLSLLPMYSSTRIDCSDKYAILTKENRHAPALVCYPKGFHESYRDEVILAMSQGHSVHERLNENYDLTSLTADHIKSILNQVSLDTDDLDDEMYQRIAEICVTGDNPYA